VRSYTDTASVTNAVETAVATGEEKVIATLPPVSLESQARPVILDATIVAAITVGSGTVILRVRRESVTGTAIFTSAAINVTTATTAALGLNAEDSPGEVAGLKYVITVAATTATVTNKSTVANVSY
jgi:hypothetical protein